MADGFCKPSPVGEGGSRRLTDEVSITLIALSRRRTDFTRARQSFSAGVQTMRARICSVLSCAMFARVVWLKLRRARNRRFYLCPFAARTCHALLPATNSCTPRWFGRRTAQVLLADFWYFWSRKSTIKEKLLYVSSRANNVQPLSRRRRSEVATPP